MDVEYFSNITSFEFDSIIGFVYHSRIDIEGIYFNIIIVLDQEYETIDVVFSKFLVIRL